MFTLRAVSRNIVMPRSALMRNASHVATFTLAEDKEEKEVAEVIRSYHLGRSLDLQKVGSELSGMKQVKSVNCLSVYVDRQNRVAFDIFKYGSIVLYNMKNSDACDYLEKIMALEADPAEAPYMMEGYDSTCLISSSISNDKPEVRQLLTSDLPTLQAVGLVLSRVTALDYYDAALDRVIENIHHLDEDGLRAHLSYIIKSVNAVEPIGDAKFSSTDAERTFKDLRGQVNGVYSEIVFKQSVLTNQYKLQGIPAFSQPATTSGR